MSQALRDAREYEEARERAIDPGDRPGFHLSPPTGWMNDPNGFSRFGGLYHLFFQYHPYDTHWGPMHWGHAVSEDLLRWRALPAALAPDAPYDRGGCFSGSAVALPDGRHLLMYTGVSAEEGGAVQTQNLAFGDGRDYVKYEKNPVITAADLPEGYSARDFRDPKLWIDPAGGLRAAVAADRPGPEGSSGRILMFRADDWDRWRLTAVVAENDGRLGRMWECPDLFRLDGHDVLLVSAQEMSPREPDYPGGFVAFYQLGQVDGAGRFIAEADRPVDWGIDFYAPQTILTPDGRRVMIAWMQNWSTCDRHDRERPWFGQMTLPRELSVSGGRLIQRPLRELEALRGPEVRHDGVTVADGELTLPGVEGPRLDLEIDLEPGDAPFERFSVGLAGDAALEFLPALSAVRLVRPIPEVREKGLRERLAKVDHDRGRLRLRLILDHSSVEAFVNDGEQGLSAILPAEPAARVRFGAKGAVRFSVRAYALDPFLPAGPSARSSARSRRRG